MQTARKQFPCSGPKLSTHRNGALAWSAGLAAAMFALLPCTALATADSAPSDLCLAAARAAATETGVPHEVLLAVSLAETGRADAAAGGALRPWPWTTGQAGAGNWFATREDAAAHVRDLLAQRVTNVDLGCFQINLRWHGSNFASVEAMLDPATNALYAARLLQSHHDRLQDWSAAAGAYHSGTEALALRYRERFDRIYAEGGGEAAAGETPPRIAVTAPRANGFPLLLAGGQGSGGSLFPAVGGGRPLIGD
jgi:Transglycosylase SLT domain